MLTDTVTQPLADMHSKHNAMVEVSTRQTTINQREKDMQFRVNAFAHKVAHYHAGDLFDIQMKCLDIAEYARFICLSLVLNFGAPSAGADIEIEVDDSVMLTGEQLRPLFKLIGRLLCMVNNKVYIQQLC